MLSGDRVSQMEREADTWDKFQHCLDNMQDHKVKSEELDLLDQIFTSLNQNIGIPIKESNESR